MREFDEDGHYRLTEDDARWANARVIRETEVHDVRFPDQLDAALNRAYCGYFHELAEKAAVVMDSFAGSQIFAAGNKRTAILMVDVLLKQSGYQLHPLW